MYVACIKEKNTYKILVRKPEGKKQLGRTRRGWEGNTDIYLREIVYGAWIALILLRIGTGSGLL